MALAVVVALVAGGGLAVWTAVPGNGRSVVGASGSRHALARSHQCPPGNLGTIAFVRGGALELLDLRGCRIRTVVRSHVAAPIAMSADGRWVGFRRGYVSSRGGPVHRLAGTPVWSPSGHELALVTAQGGVEVGRAGGPLRRLLPDRWGAWTATFSPGGRFLGVSRTAGHPAYVEQIWIVDLTTGSKRELFREPRREGAPLLLQGFSPDGRWLLSWKDLYASASILADGVPLIALPVAGGQPRVVTSELYHDDYVSWCGNRPVYVLNRHGRFVTQGDGIATAAPPSWRATTLLPATGQTSWGAFSCNSGGTLVVAAGPKNEDDPFGHERRSIWLVHGKTASVLPQTRPPRGTSDEWPSWSAEGRWVLFVRTRFNGKAWPGKLYAADASTGKLAGPIASIGATENYYGHYNWTSQIFWHRP